MTGKATEEEHDYWPHGTGRRGGTHGVGRPVEDRVERWKRPVDALQRGATLEHWGASAYRRIVAPSRFR